MASLLRSLALSHASCSFPLPPCHRSTTVASSSLSFLPLFLLLSLSFLCGFLSFFFLAIDGSLPHRGSPCSLSFFLSPFLTICLCIVPPSARPAPWVPWQFFPCRSRLGLPCPGAGPHFVVVSFCSGWCPPSPFRPWLSPPCFGSFARAISQPCFAGSRGWPVQCVLFVLLPPSHRQFRSAALGPRSRAVPLRPRIVITHRLRPRILLVPRPPPALAPVRCRCSWAFPASLRPGLILSVAGGSVAPGRCSAAVTSRSRLVSLFS